MKRGSIKNGNHLQKRDKSLINNNSNNSDTKELKKSRNLLLSVPLYFYLEFIKINYTPIFLCTIGILGIILGYLLVPFELNKTPLKLSQEFSLSKYDSKKSDSAYIQSYDPLVYEEMLKELRLMQQTLQMKQQATDRKTQSLQRVVNKLRTTSCENANYLNDEKTKNMIKQELTTYDADKLGLRDYALESLGGNVISTPNTSPALSSVHYVLFGFIRFQTYSNPRVVIQADVIPGKCFAFEGEQGKIRIKLSNKIFISAITFEHVSRSLLTQVEISSAPKSFQIKGLDNENDDTGTILGQFIYSIDGPPRQTFLIANNIATTPTTYEFVELYILNNYGNVDYTCVYRIRIHGQVVDK